MGLLDQFAGEVLGALSGDAQGASPSQTSNLLQSVMGFVNSQPDGLQGLVRQFQEQGLGAIVNSWVSTGQNQPISIQQLQSVLGSDLVTKLAQQAGLSPDQGLGALAQLLPQVVDKLTPGGEVE
jgi:uncharacterized protein YidB (DUF937 family)